MLFLVIIMIAMLIIFVLQVTSASGTNYAQGLKILIYIGFVILAIGMIVGFLNGDFDKTLDKIIQNIQ